MITIDSLREIRSSQYFRGFEGIDGPTPVWLCESQLDSIECDYSNPNTKWLFPAAGHGTYAILTYWRYMEGLSTIFINNDDRSRHILNNMLYLNEINPWLCRQLRKHGFINVIEGDYNDFNFNMKFDIGIGNPPYHLNDGGGNGSSAVSIYDKFTNKTLEICDRVLFITPSRWFKGGKGLSDFRLQMLNRTDVKFIKHYQNEKVCFDVELPGGVSYFYIDKEYSGTTKFIDYETNTEVDIKLNTRDILISDVVSNRIIDKILAKNLKDFSGEVLSQNPFGVRAKFNNWVNEGIECRTKDGVKFISDENINDKFNILNKYKVITSIADGAAYKSKKYTSRCDVIKPNTICTETYLICYTSDDINKCHNVEKYLMTKFSRFMLSLRMAAQTKSKDKFKWVPVLNFDKSWEDSELYEYFNLTDSEIDLIEKSVR